MISKVTVFLLHLKTFSIITFMRGKVLKVVP